jgi:hypothetical protein
MPRLRNPRVVAKLRVQLAWRECRRAEKQRDTAHADVTAAYIALGEALLAGKLGAAFKRKGRK